MAATDMNLAGLEIGCKVSVTNMEALLQTGVVVDLFYCDPPSRRLLGADVLMDSGQPAGGKTLGVRKEAIVRDYEDAQAARQKRMEVLFERYPTDSSLERSDTVERFCGVAQATHALDDSYWFEWADTFEDCASYLADEIFDGWDPVAIFDLDTGELIDLHISTPVISRSEDQGMTANPLDPDAHALHEAITEEDR